MCLRVICKFAPNANVATCTHPLWLVFTELWLHNSFTLMWNLKSGGVATLNEQQLWCRSGWHICLIYLFDFRSKTFAGEGASVGTSAPSTPGKPTWCFRLSVCVSGDNRHTLLNQGLSLVWLQTLKAAKTWVKNLFQNSGRKQTNLTDSGKTDLFSHLLIKSL